MSGLNVGELAAFLTLDDDNFQRGLTDSGGGMSNLLGIGRTAALGIGAAMAGGAAYSLMAFTDFDKGMREVFTLLPGISDSAMADMTQQVKDFSTEFGVLPDQVIPSLYQALSAGVPPDNVFQFLETAQMAARGGVTELETAVDGISSVVNAYGSDVLGATEASDLMFTAVRMGKTNFEELSASLFQVTPTAAGLGISFGQVTAALSTLTAQGVPTSVATTQIRQALVELGDSGGELGQTFQELSGQTFRDFIAGGGTLQDALGMLEGHASDTGVGIGELFGSVEAGQAALALTGQGTETFSRNLAAMDDSAGATQAAYDSMSDGMAFQFDRLKAAATVLAIDVGGRLAELALPFLELASSVMDAFGEGGISGALTRLRSAFDGLSGPMQILAGAGGMGLLAGIAVVVAGALSFLLSPVILVAAAIGALVAGVIYAYTHWETFRKVVDAVASWLVGTAWPAYQRFAQGILDVYAGIASWFQDNWPTIQAVVVTVLAALLDAFRTVQAWVDTNWPTISDVIEGVATIVSVAAGRLIDSVQNIVTFWAGALEVLGDILGQAGDFISGMWERFGGQWLGHVQVFISALVDLIGGIVDIVQGIIDVVAGVFTGDWGRVWEGIKSIVNGVWDAIGALIRMAINGISGAIGAGMALISQLWSMAWAGIKNLVGLAWQAILSAVQGYASMFIGFWQALPGRIVGALSALGGMLSGAGRSAFNAWWNAMKSVWGSVAGWLGGLGGAAMRSLGNMASTLYNAGRDIINGLWNGLKDKWGDVTSWLSGLGDQITSLKGPIEKDRVLLRPIGQAIMEGLDSGLRDRWAMVASTLAATTDMVAMRSLTPDQLAGAIVSAGAPTGDAASAPDAMGLEDGTYERPVVLYLEPGAREVLAKGTVTVVRADVRKRR